MEEADQSREEISAQMPPGEHTQCAHACVCTRESMHAGCVAENMGLHPHVDKNGVRWCGSGPPSRPSLCSPAPSPELSSLGFGAPALH